MDNNSLANLVLRIGLAFCFLYAGIAGFLHPEDWVGWFPRFATDAIDGAVLLNIWGVYEIVTGLWLLWGKHIFWPSLAASFSLAGLIVFNLSVMDVIFRDVTILTVAIALAIENFPRPQEQQQ